MSLLSESHFESQPKSQPKSQPLSNQISPNPRCPNDSGQVLPREASHELHGSSRQVGEQVRVVVPTRGQGPAQHGQLRGGVLLESVFGGRFDQRKPIGFKCLNQRKPESWTKNAFVCEQWLLVVRNKKMSAFVVIERVKLKKVLYLA